MDASNLNMLTKPGVAWNRCECHHCRHLSKHGNAVQAQSSHGCLTWLLLGVATKLLLTAELSMKRLAAYAAALPRCKVTEAHKTSHTTRHPHVAAVTIGAHAVDKHNFFHSALMVCRQYWLQSFLGNDADTAHTSNAVSPP